MSGLHAISRRIDIGQVRFHPTSHAERAPCTKRDTRSRAEFGIWLHTYGNENEVGCFRETVRASERTVITE
jgi:hypothetical protein